VSVYIVNNDAVSRRGGIVLKLKKKNAVRIRSLKKKRKKKKEPFYIKKGLIHINTLYSVPLSAHTNHKNLVGENYYA